VANIGKRVKWRTWHWTDSLLGEKRRMWRRRKVEREIGSFTHKHDRDRNSTARPRNGKRTVLVTTAGTTSAARTRHRKSNSLRGGGQWQTIALFRLKRSAVTVHLMRTASERGSGLQSVSLMFRLLLRLFDEFSDTFDPAKSSLTSTDVQNE
jgi:hypothetical protein